MPGISRVPPSHPSSAQHRTPPGRRNAFSGDLPISPRRSERLRARQALAPVSPTPVRRRPATAPSPAQPLAAAQFGASPDSPLALGSPLLGRSLPHTQTRPPVTFGSPGRHSPGSLAIWAESVADGSQAHLVGLGIDFNGTIAAFGGPEITSEAESRFEFLRSTLPDLDLGMDAAALQAALSITGEHAADRMRWALPLVNYVLELLADRNEDEQPLPQQELLRLFRGMAQAPAEKLVLCCVLLSLEGPARGSMEAYLRASCSFSDVMGLTDEAAVHLNWLVPSTYQSELYDVRGVGDRAEIALAVRQLAAESPAEQTALARSLDTLVGHWSPSVPQVTNLNELLKSLMLFSSAERESLQAWWMNLPNVTVDIAGRLIRALNTVERREWPRLWRAACDFADLVERNQSSPRVRAFYSEHGRRLPASPGIAEERLAYVEAWVATQFVGPRPAEERQQIFELALRTSGLGNFGRRFQLVRQMPPLELRHERIRQHLTPPGSPEAVPPADSFPAFSFR